MSALGGNIRTIWITLRAMNYTQRVFDDMARQMTNLQASQKKVAQSTNQMADASMHMLVAGTMLLTLSLMIGQQLWNLAASSKEGASTFAALTKNFNETKDAFANTLFEMLQFIHVFDILNGILNILKSNKALQVLLLIFVAFLTVLIAAWGVLWILKGAFGAVTGALNLFNIGLISAGDGEYAFMIGEQGLVFTTMELAEAIGIVAVSFMVFVALSHIIGRPAAIIVAAIVAITAAIIALKAVGTWGASLPEDTAFVAGALAVGAGLAAGAMALGVFQAGTRGVPRTGLVYAHKGETIFNPATGRPTQVENDLMGGRGQNTYENVEVKIDTINTKAEYDDVDEQIRRALRKGMRGRR